MQQSPAVSWFLINLLLIKFHIKFLCSRREDEEEHWSFNIATIKLIKLMLNDNAQTVKRWFIVFHMRLVFVFLWFWSFMSRRWPWMAPSSHLNLIGQLPFAIIPITVLAIGQVKGWMQTNWFDCALFSSLCSLILKVQFSFKS